MLDCYSFICDLCKGFYLFIWSESPASLPSKCYLKWFILVCTDSNLSAPELRKNKAAKLRLMKIGRETGENLPYSL